LQLLFSFFDGNDTPQAQSSLWWKGVFAFRSRERMAVTLFDVAPVLILVGFVAIGCLGVPAYARQSESQSAEARVATNVTALITGQGYAFEEHAVQTLDDYILAIQRIPYGLAGPSADGAKVLPIRPIVLSPFPLPRLERVCAGAGGGGCMYVYV
jgi:hypothetical protein